MSVRELQFRVATFTGADALWALILSPERMALRVARGLLRVGGGFGGIIPEDGASLVIVWPGGLAFEVYVQWAHVWEASNTCRDFARALEWLKLQPPNDRVKFYRVRPTSPPTALPGGA